MEIHKPKPVHGWRELVGEIAIIVVGVLIALVAEQTVQALEWRHKAHVAEEAMRRELASDDGPQAYVRYAAHPCIVGALDRIRTAVELDAPRATVRELIDRYYTPFWTWDALAYGAASASDVPLHIPAERMNLWTTAYVLMPALNTANAKEFNDAAALVSLSRTGGALTPAERDRTLLAVETLRRDALSMFTAVSISLPAIYATGARLDRTVLDRALGSLRRVYGSACLQPPPGPPSAAR